jgi:hypothetical protein
MRAATAGRVLAAACCLVGLLACRVMWHEAGLPPKERPLHVFGASGGKGISSEIYPESSILWSGGICVMTLLGIVGLVGRGSTSPEWHWGPAFVAVGVLLVLFLHQARGVNGTDTAAVQPGHVLGLFAGTGLVGAGGVVLVGAWRSARRTDGRS